MIERNTKEAYDARLSEIQTQLHNANLAVDFGRAFYDSNCTINGESVYCMGADVGVHGGDATVVELRLQDPETNTTIVVKGHIASLEVPIHIEGQFVPMDAEFEDPVRALRALAHRMERDRRSV